ncbi:MAG: vWA domain-containing protein [Ferruginibacter sp.]
MKTLLLSCLLFFALFLVGCSKDGLSDMSSGVSGSGSGSSSGGGSSNPGNPGPGQAGVITAAEWNDINNWAFWKNLMVNDTFSAFSQRWKIYNNNRVSVHVMSSTGLPAIDVVIQLKKNSTVIFTTRTDNKGRAECWAGLFQYNNPINLNEYSLVVNNGSMVLSTVKNYEVGINEIILPVAPVYQDNIDVSFVVDATGSMGDELNYLKTELNDVISRAKAAHPTASFKTSAVYYRDEGDDYLTRVSPFTSNTATTLSFINAQSAGGGGDFPEAVHTALDKAVNELTWSASAKTRLIFLVLDAPPHFTPAVISSLQASLNKANEKGIKIIPVTASGIDKETEFLMRFFSISTNGSYVFITNDSGIGGNHITATVGAYQVEFLNNLMVRLINKYAE